MDPILFWIIAALGVLLSLTVFVIFASFAMIMIAGFDKEPLDLDYDFEN